MLERINEEKILFLDIETVPCEPDFDNLDNKFQELWDKKTSYIQEKENKSGKDVYEKAGIFAEFGKIICISCAFISKINNTKSLRIKSFFGDDEKLILSGFIELLNKYYYSDGFLLCAHNGKEFDFPYIARRILINGLKLPKLLDIAGKKPWEIKHLDTMELWKFGDYKHYTSLDLLTKIFNISTPKDDISGSDVSKVYWEEKDLQRIVKYCQKDVLAVVQLFFKYRGEELIPEENIEIIS
ncbi:MAG: 3'-5' exonuclease [Bacteroidales bacterium]|nr:3'-5' exonuclease [Bacteroidales bacterium]